MQSLDSGARCDCVSVIHDFPLLVQKGDGVKLAKLSSENQESHHVWRDLKWLFPHPRTASLSESMRAWRATPARLIDLSGPQFTLDALQHSPHGPSPSEAQRPIPDQAERQACSVPRPQRDQIGGPSTVA